MPGPLWKRFKDFTATHTFVIGPNATFTNNGAMINAGKILTRSTTLITTKTVLAKESGTTFILSLAGGFTVTLPAHEAGLNYRFKVGVNPTTSYFIVTDGGTDTIAGGINELEVDTADDGPSDLNADSIELTAASASVGDYINLESDGTTWFLNGQTALDGGVVLSTT